MARASDSTGGDIVLAQSSSQLEDLKDALTSSQVTGWDILGALAVMVVSIPVSLLVSSLATRALRRIPNLPDEFVLAGSRTSRWLVYLIALAWSLSLLGVTVDWIVIVVAVVVVVVIVLMARPMVENGAAGLLLTMRPAFGEGDQITTAGYRGTVAEIGSRSTVLTTADGPQIHIPNSQVLSGPIVVFTASDNRKASFDITVAYDADLNAAAQALLEAVSGVDGVQQDPAPKVQARIREQHHHADGQLLVSVIHDVGFDGDRWCHPRVPGRPRRRRYLTGCTRCRRRQRARRPLGRRMRGRST